MVNGRRELRQRRIMDIFGRHLHKAIQAKTRMTNRRGFDKKLICADTDQTLDILAPPLFFGLGSRGRLRVIWTVGSGFRKQVKLEWP
jgi:hypothetical protein